jgi:TetR/AcrR family transcriptional regulator, transcriptional repressor of bet genes
VDVERQQAEIAEAVWRLAARSGLEAVSVREVAAEAGVSAGRVQHYFRTKDAMLLYGMRLAQDRMETRIFDRLRRLPDEASAEDILRAAIDELLGDHPDTRLVRRVGIAYLGRAMEDRHVAEVLFGDDAELRELAATAVRAAQAAHRAAPDLDVEHEARAIWSLVNGLGMEVACGQHSPARARATMQYYLDRLLGPINK